MTFSDRNCPISPFPTIGESEEMATFWNAEIINQKHYDGVLSCLNGYYTIRSLELQKIAENTL